MKKVILTKILILFGFFIYSQNEYFLKAYNYFEIDLSENIQFQSNPLIDFIKSNGIQSIEKPFKTKDVNLQHTYLLKTTSNVTLESLLENTKQYSFIEYIEEVPQYELFYTPNDPLYAQQYALPLINAPLAWDLATCVGNSQVVLAITDDAVRITHEDIAPILWNNPNEIPNNGIDDDNNGYIDDVVGWDAADNDNNPSPPASASTSYFSHGTHVAGIAGGATDNNLGIASIGFGVQLMPVKIGANSSGSLVGAWAGIDYTISCGYVDVVNMSWGGGSYSATYQNLITAGYNQGITFVAAAGNSNTSAPMYPASYNHVISVAATNQTDTRASFSNYGTTVDVAAPGVAILSTVAGAGGANNQYDYKQGTSMASPLVAGLCALMKCYNYGATPDMIENCLKTTAVNIDAQNPSYINQLGAGRVDAQAALQCLSTSPTVSFHTDDTLVCPNQSIQFYSQSSGVQPLTYSWSFPGGTPATSTLQNPIVSYPNTGTYTVTLTVTNAYGNDVLTKTNYITVSNPTATISGNATIVPGGIAFLRVDFTGMPPYSITYSDGTNNYTVNGIQYSPYYIQVNPTNTTTYTLVSMSNANCSGSTSGSAEVSINTNSNPFCTDLFQKVIDDSGATERGNIFPTNDGGYIISASTTAYGSGSYDVMLYKYDNQDNLMWSKTYGTSSSELSTSIPLTEMDNGDIVFACESNQRLHCLRVNNNGNIVWQKRLNISSGDCQGKNLIKDGNDILIVGSIRGFGVGNYDAYIYKIDGNGNPLWSNMYGTSSNDHIDDILKSSSGDYYVVGATDSQSPSVNFLSKISNAGVVQWTKKYTKSGSTEQLKSIIEAPNGDLIAYGNTGNPSVFDLKLIKFDVNGNILSSIKMAGNNEDRVNEIFGLSDGSVIISGYTNSLGHGNYDLFVSKYDNSFNEIWTKVYGGSGSDRTNPLDNNLYVNESEGFGIIVGNTQSFGGTDKDLYIVKFSLNDDTLCNEIKGQLWNNSNLNLQTATQNFTLGTMPSLVNANFISLTAPVTETTVCEVECSNNQTACTDLFQKYYDNSQDSKNISNDITSDGGYVIAGMTTSYGAGQEDIFVVKYNANNQVEWSNTYGTTLRELASTAYIIQTTANDYLVAFESTAYSDRTDAGGLVYMRLDATGNIIWQKTIDVSGSSYLHASSILEYNNEFYLMGSSGGGAQIYTLKIDGNGNRIWMKKLMLGGFDHGMRYVIGDNGKLYGCGSTTAFSGTQSIIFQQDIISGNIDWLKTYDNLCLDGFFYSINKDMYNNLFAIGVADNAFVLTKVDYNGNIIWNKKFDNIGVDYAAEVMISGDNSIYMAGKTNSAGHGSYDVFVTKLDANGVEQWTKLYGGAAEEDIFHRDGFFKINENEGYGLLSYATRSYGGNDFDIAITKLSLGTDTVCNEINTVLWNETNINITPVVRTFSEGTYPVEINANMTKLTMPVMESVICEVLCNTQSNSNCNYLKSYNNYNTVNDIVYKSATNQLYMSGGTVNGNLFIANMETDGTTNWSREYSANAGTTSFVGTVLFADNNSDILTVELKNDQAIIYRIDNAGNIVWNKRLQNGIIRRPKLVNAGNNQYYMVCWYAPSGTSDNVVVYKFDGNGNVLWSYQYHYSDDQFFRVISNGAGGLAMAGVLSANPFLLEIDPNGNIIHSKIESSPNYSLYRSIFKDGNFYYTHGSDKSGSNTKFFIEKFDTNFNPIWKQSTGWMPNRDVYDGEILKDSYGNLYLYTPVYVGSTIQDELMIKFDASGNILKEKTSALNNSLLLHGTTVPSASAEELIIAYTSPYFSNGNKVGVIKTDTALSACILVDTTLAFSSVSSSTNSINFNRSNITLNAINDVPTVNTLSVLTETECEVNCDSNPNSLLCINLDSVQKISNTEGNFSALLDVGDRFGRSITSIGDFNGDGIEDVAVGASYDDDGCMDCGAIYLLYLNQNGTVNNYSKISNTQGGFTGTFTGHAGIAIANVGDLDGNGVIDLAVGASQDNDGGSWTGAVWILFLNSSGNVINYTKLSKTTGASMLPIFPDDRFGISIANLGDVNNDGVIDLAVGATQNDNGGVNRGSVFVLNLNTSGNIVSYQQISSNSTFMSGALDNNDGFGLSVSKLNDINGDGNVEILVGVNFDDDGGSDVGAAYIIYLNSLGNAIGKSKISATAGNFTGTLNSSDNFAGTVSNIGDIDGDGIDDIVLGAFKDDDGANDAGAVWLCTLNPNGTVKEFKKFSELTSSLINLDAGDLFASSIANIGDLNNDGINEIGVGAILDDDGGTDKGAVYILFLDDTCATQPITCQNSTLDTLICLGDSIQINLGNASNVHWSPNYNISDVNSSNPSLWTETDTAYIVYYEDSICQYFDTINIQVSSLQVEASFEDTLICPNQNVQLNANGALSYSWVSGANLNNANIANPIFSGNATETLIVTGQNSDGCIATDTVTINVLSCCGAFADFEINDSIICINESVTFTNTSIAGFNPTFTWNFGIGASPSSFVGQNPPSVTYSVPGVHQVQLILSDDCGQDTLTKNIYVNDLPLINIANDTSICGNDTIHYQLGDDGIADYTYTWTPSNGLDNANIANPIASINYSETYTVVVADNFTGCVSTDSVSIHFTNKPDTIIKYSSNSICANDSVWLYIDAPNDSLIWNNGSQADTLNFVLLQDTQITVRLFIDSCIFYDTLNMEVDTIPNVNLVFNDTVCANSWDTINVQTTGIPVWESGDTATAYPVFIAQDTILYLTTYNGLCGVEDTIRIYTRDLPEDSIIGVDTVCINSTESYTVAGAYNYLWSNGSTSNSATYTIESDTTIYVTYTDAYCQNTDSFNVFVVDTPQIVIIGDTNYCNGDVVNLMVNTTDSIYWNNGTIGNIYNGNANVLNNTIVVNQFNDYCGMVSDSVTLNIDTIPVRNLIYQDTVCTNSWDTINVQTTGIPVWGSGDTATAYPVFIAQDTILYLTTYNGLCGAEDTIRIYTRDLPEDSIIGVDTVCINSTESYTVAGAYNYLWSNGSTSNSATYTIESDTTIYVTYTDAYCQNTDSFNVFVVDTPQIVIIGDTNYCNGDVVNLMVNTTDSIYWNNGTIGNIYNGNATVSNNTIVVNQFNDYCGMVSDSVTLNIDTIPVRLFNYTDTVCQFETDTITIISTGITSTLNNDTVTQIDFVVNNDTSVILQTYNGYCRVYDTIQIYVRLLPNLNIMGNDTTCINTVETYSLPAGYTYLWSNGATTNSTQYAIIKDTSIIVNYEDEYCNNTDSIFILAIDTPIVEILGDSIYCEGDIFDLSIATNDSVWWSVGSNENPLVDTATISETITATLYNDYCGNYTSSINLYVDTFPQIEIVSPIEMYENDETQAEVIGSAVDWYWTPPYGLSCVNCKEPIINADSSMVYILQAINNSCISYDTLIVNIKNLQDCLLIPTAFSPNGDAVNNTFKPIVLDEKTIVQSFTIYNRWGEKIHDSLSPWDGNYKGQPQNIGVYMYVVEYYCDGENKVLSGNVTLIR